MAMLPRRTRSIALACALSSLVIASACTPGLSPQTRSPTGPGGDRPAGDRPAKALTIGVTSAIQAFGMVAAGTPVGGWTTVNEVHSQGLVTSDVDSRKPIGRLSVNVPSFDDGTMEVLTDGGLQVTYRLRPGVTWHDGVAFTARDLTFSYELESAPGLSAMNRDAIDQIAAVDTPDDATFVIAFKGPYYLAATLGVELFWPYPEHLLRGPFERYQTSGNAEEFVNNPYWTSTFVNLGPFRVTVFDPGEGVTMEAYDGFFLGRPRIDVVRVRSFSDQNALFSNLLAGAVHLFFNVTLDPDLGSQLRDMWTQSGQGVVQPVPGYTRFLAPQWRPAFQRESSVSDLRVRAAMYYALDRDALSDVVQAGRKDLVAYAILPPFDPNFEGSRDGLRQYRYDPERARALLLEAGWTRDQDGALRHSIDGRRFHTAIWANSRWGRETATLADFWRRTGMEVDEYLVPGALTRDREHRAGFPGWETTSRFGDGILRTLEEPPAGPETRWAGGSGGYNDPRARRLVEVFRRSMTSHEQIEAYRALTAFVAAELPILPLYYEADYIGVRSGVKALEDFRGGGGSTVPYGLYSRNAHLWDVQ
jgi:peptide/nickel transport system substrate-binding protein